jgi:hypothetical protein
MPEMNSRPSKLWNVISMRRGWPLRRPVVVMSMLWPCRRTRRIAASRAAASSGVVIGLIGLVMLGEACDSDPG